eukprot:TRINITY_DN9157_c0_g2_i1.p1 TRINITY_DN9157_c0_g2~~TRINITY_DN9157_c0_g2_i1.p1  ORF type:complete len:212 (-),score=51.28 TRINITY_DN9157_c0_g2_i1:90-665(-)
MTPLHFAAAGGHAEMVTVLIRKGADTAATNKQGQTPLDLAKDEAVAEALRTGAGQITGAEKEDAVKSKVAKEDDNVQNGTGEGQKVVSESGKAERHTNEKAEAEEENPAAETASAVGEPAETTTGRESGGTKEEKVETKAVGKTGKGNLRKHRGDQSEETVGEAALASEGPAGKKAKTVNLSYFDTDGEET